MIFFCLRLVETTQFNEVELCFLAAGHKKNECDGAFGNGKRKFWSSNVRNPMDMCLIIEES